MKLGYVGRISILFPIALGSALAGANVIHRAFQPDLVRPLTRCSDASGRGPERGRPLRTPI